MSKQRTTGSEAKAALGELVAELDHTRKEFAKATLHLTQAETTIQHLKDAETKKESVISHLEKELHRKEEAHKEECSILIEEHKAHVATLSQKMRQIELDNSKLHQELESALLFEKENRQLRDTILEHQATVERLQTINEELRNRAQEDTREHARQMESEFKRRLEESEKRFRTEAYKALSEEAKIALQGNDHLQTVLQRQNDSIEAVLQKCRQLEQAHGKVSHDHDMTQQSLQHHLAETQRLKKQLVDSKTHVDTLEEELKQRKVERASLELLFIEYESTRKQLAKEKDRARRSVRETERWQARAIQLTEELTDDQRVAAEKKLAAVASHNDRMESMTSRVKARKERREQSKITAKAGASILKATRESGSDDEDWAAVSDDDDVTTADGRLNPMEILSMWNVKYDDWLPPAPSASHQTVQEQAQKNAELPSEIQATPLPVLASSARKPGLGSVAKERAENDSSLSVVRGKTSSKVPHTIRQMKKASWSRLATGTGPAIPLSGDLSVVSHGEVAKKKVNVHNRFLVP